MGESVLQLRSGTIAVLSIQATQFSFIDLINLLICICDDLYFCLILYNVYSRHQLKLVNLLIRTEQLGFYFGVCRTCCVYSFEGEITSPKLRNYMSEVICLKTENKTNTKLPFCGFLKGGFPVESILIHELKIFRTSSSR